MRDGRRRVMADMIHRHHPPRGEGRSRKEVGVDWDARGEQKRAEEVEPLSYLRGSSAAPIVGDFDPDAPCIALS